MTKAEEKLIAQAQRVLKITNPIYRIDVDGNTVTFFLCGHIEPLVWTKPTRKRPKGATKVTA